MMTALTMVGGVAIIATIIVLLDTLGRRQQRRTREAAARSVTLGTEARSRS